jgi:hypothetical protein
MNEFRPGVGPHCRYPYCSAPFARAVRRVSEKPERCHGHRRSSGRRRQLHAMFVHQPPFGSILRTLRHRLAAGVDPPRCAPRSAYSRESADSRSCSTSDGYWTRADHRVHPNRCAPAATPPASRRSAPRSGSAAARPAPSARRARGADSADGAGAAHGAGPTDGGAGAARSTRGCHGRPTGPAPGAAGLGAGRSDRGAGSAAIPGTGSAGPAARSGTPTADCTPRAVATPGDRT